MTGLVFVLIGTALYLFALLPRWVAEGEVFGVYFPFRGLRLEERSRFLRFLPFLGVGVYLSGKYGKFSLQALSFVVGGVLIGSAVVLAVSAWGRRGLSRDAARGADYQDLVGPSE